METSSASSTMLTTSVTSANAGGSGGGSGHSHSTSSTIPIRVLGAASAGNNGNMANNNATQLRVAAMSRSNRINDFIAKINLLNSANVDDELQIASLQDVNNYIESMQNLPEFPAFQRQAFQTIFSYLSTQPKTFILEHKGHQKKKLCLEIFSRFVFTDLRTQVVQILDLLHDLIENDNEDNAILAMRIVADFHKKIFHFKIPAAIEQAKKFLELNMRIMRNFIENHGKLRKNQKPILINDIAELSSNSTLIESIIKDSLSVTVIQVRNSHQHEQHLQQQQQQPSAVIYKVLPLGINSMKVAVEIPMLVLMFNSLYKASLEAELLEFVPLSLKIIQLKFPEPEPASEVALAKLRKTEIYHDFAMVQCKYLSVISYMLRINDEKIHHLIPPDQFPAALLSVFRTCPNEANNIRRDLLFSTRYIVQTRYRVYFLKYLHEFFNETILLGNGWTTRESLRSLACSVTFDLVHHTRDQLSQNDLLMSIDTFSKVLFDDTLSVVIAVMACRVTLNLTDSFIKLCEKEKQMQTIRQVLWKIFELYIAKIKSIVRVYIPSMAEKVRMLQAQQKKTEVSTATAAGVVGEKTKEAETVTPSKTATTVVGAATVASAGTQKVTVTSDMTSAAMAAGDTTFFSSLMTTLSYQEPDFDVEDRIVKEKDEPKLRFGYPEQAFSPNQIAEMRTLIKTMFSGLKMSSLKMKDIAEKYPPEVGTSLAVSNPQARLFRCGFARPKDIDLLVDIFKYGLKLFEFYNLAATIAQLQQQQNSRDTKETSSTSKEKEPINTASNVMATPNKASGGGWTSTASGGQQQQQSTTPVTQPRTASKEEKEVIDCFVNIFSSLSPQTYRLVAQQTIDFFIESLHANVNIQLIAHSLIYTQSTSAIFCNVLIEYLLKRMELMGSNPELSNLYLKLYKLIFGSVQVYPNDNEMMLKPHLHRIVNSSMQMALKAKEPYNYFSLLRALFRSIGGGAHDQLYQEFLPMLPTLLQGLNTFQSGVHRQNMRDLFVELCLTIPVRLSSLLPYLPWLMDPLVSALNGTHSLVAQGLRTLELCVDNLQPDFLYEHIQPVRTELMQSLCRTLKNPSDVLSSTSFRILGKLGGASHKQMVEPQKLDFIDLMATPAGGDGHELVQAPIQGVYSYISIAFTEVEQQPIYFPIDRVLEAAYRGICKSSMDSYYRQQCWEVVKGFFVAYIQTTASQEEQMQLWKFFSHSSFLNGNENHFVASMMATINGSSGSAAGSGSGAAGCSNGAAGDTGGSSSSMAANIFYKFPDEKLRRVHELAIKAMLTASAVKELYGQVFNFMVPLVRYYTLVAISQQAGPVTLTNRSMGAASQRAYGMDPLVLIDATMAVMGQEENELCKPGNLVLRIIIDTSISVLGSKERASQLPLFEYILKKLCALCYERPWFSKYGGCFGIRYLFEITSFRWLLRHQFAIFKAMFYVLFELSNDLSCGVIEMAKENLDTLIKICASPVKTANGGEAELIEQQKAFNREVMKDLILLITSSNKVVREEAMHLLQVYGQLTCQSVAAVMEPFKEKLGETLRKGRLSQNPLLIQIGILEGTTFCLRLRPKLFNITDKEVDNPVIQGLYQELQTIVQDASNEERLPAKSVSMYPKKELMIQLKVAAMKTYASYHCVPNLLDEIFTDLYQLLVTSNNAEIQETAFRCIEEFKDELNLDLIRSAVRGLMTDFNFRELPQAELTKCFYLARLFSGIFNDKFCEQILNYLSSRVHANIAAFLKKKEAEAPLTGVGGGQKKVELDVVLPESDFLIMIEREASQCVKIIDLFTDVSATSEAYIEHLFNFLLKMEEIYDVFLAGRFYQSITRFLKRFPSAAVEQFERRIDEEALFRFFLYVLNSPEHGSSFRAVIETNPGSLLMLLKTSILAQNGGGIDMEVDGGGGTATTKTATIGGNCGDDQGQLTGNKGIDQATNWAATMNGISSTGARPTSPSSFNRYQAIKLISIIVKHNPTWLATQPELINILKSIWLSPEFHREHAKSFHLNSAQWREPKLLVKCLLRYYDINRGNFELFFSLFEVFNLHYHCGFEFFRKYLKRAVEKYPTGWKRVTYLAYLDYFHPTTGRGARTPNWTYEIEAKILQYLLVPMFAHSFEAKEVEELLGPLPEEQSGVACGTEARRQQHSDDLITKTINQIIQLEAGAAVTKACDSVHIHILQLCVLMVEHASYYIKPISNDKNQSTKVRALMAFVWQSLADNTMTDSSTKYYGHLLLAHIISKFAIHKKIVRQVFNSLLKGYSTEAKLIVKASLEVLLPALPTRIDDVPKYFVSFTKSQMIQENYANNHLVSLLQMIVRYYQMYYAQRDQFVCHIVTQMQRLGLHQNVQPENRKVALDLAEVLIRWEYRRLREERQQSLGTVAMKAAVVTKGSTTKVEVDNEKDIALSTQMQRPLLGHMEPLDKEYFEQMLFFLVRFVCGVYDFPHQSTGPLNSSAIQPPSADQLFVRAMTLIRAALRLDLYPNMDFRQQFLFVERLLISVKEPTGQVAMNCNYTSVCMSLELLILYMQELRPEVVLRVIKPLQKAIAVAATCSNTRVVRTVHNLLARLMALFPPSLTCSIHGGSNPLQAQPPPGGSCNKTNKVGGGGGGGTGALNEELEPLEQLYTEVHSIILAGFGAYEKSMTFQLGGSGGPGATPGGLNITVQNPNTMAASAGQQQQQQQMRPIGDIQAQVGGGANQLAVSGNNSSPMQSLSQLYGTLMILKATCMHHPTYIDRLLTPFMHMLQKLVKEHITMVAMNQHASAGGGGTGQQPNFNATLCVEIIALSLDLIKGRIGVISNEMRRQFLHQVFIQLIDKSPDPKIMKSILRIFEEWIKHPLAAQQGSRASSGTQHHSIANTLKDKTLMLLRIFARMDKGPFQENPELQQIFLELIHYIYSDETLKSTDLTNKLEQAFMAGLRCPQASIRNKFFALLDGQLKRRLYDRLQYIACQQNWEQMGGHFWIKQCIELILAVALPNWPLSTPNQFAVLPLPMSLVPLFDYDKFGGGAGGVGGPGITNGFGPIDAISCTPTDMMMMDFEDFLGNGTMSPIEDIGSTKAQQSLGNESIVGATSNTSEPMDVDVEHGSSYLNQYLNAPTSSTMVATALNAITPNKLNQGTLGGRGPTSDPKQNLLEVVCSFLNCLQSTRSHAFIIGMAKLCQIDNQLAHHVWIQLLPRIMPLLTREQHILFTTQLATFFASGIHGQQVGQSPNAIATMFEAVAHCEPKVVVQPLVMQYLSKQHNVWHRAILLTEQLLEKVETNSNLNVSYLNCLINLGSGVGGATGQSNTSKSIRGGNTSGLTLTIPASVVNGMLNGEAGGGAATGVNAAAGTIAPSCGVGSTTSATTSGGSSGGGSMLTTNLNEIIQPEVSMPEGFLSLAASCYSTLSTLYEELKEEDHWAGLWHRSAQAAETIIGIGHEQQGRFELAKAAYELAMTRAMNRYMETAKPASYLQRDEMCLWERRWIRCSMELNQWDSLLEYGQSHDCLNPALVMEAAWRIPNWDEMSTALAALSSELNKTFDWKVNLYRGYNAICNPMQRNLDMVEKCIELVSACLIHKWRRLPHIISRAHLDILHGGYQMIELHEAATLHQSLLAVNQSTGQMLDRTHQDVKSVIKTWKNRMPNLADDLSHWADIFTWRQHNYQTIVARFEAEALRLGSQGGQQQQMSPSAAATQNQNNICQHLIITGSHQSALSLINYARVARKHGVINLALDSLNRIHTIPKVPIVDCYNKIRQQLKCHLALNRSPDDLQEGLAIIDSANLAYFGKEMHAELYAMKGHFLYRLGQFEEANKSFSAAVQIAIRSHPSQSKPWAMWAEYLDDMFSKSTANATGGDFETCDMLMGESAIIAYLNACRINGETKAIKYMPKIFWLLSLDDPVRRCLFKAFEQYVIGIPVYHWIHWVPQLLAYLVGPLNTERLTSVMVALCKQHPGAIFFPLRRIYISEKGMVREMFKTINNKNAMNLNKALNNQAQLLRRQQQQQQATVVQASTASSGTADDSQSDSQGGGVAQSQPPLTLLDGQSMLAPSSMLRLSHVMRIMRETNPIVINTLEGIVEQINLIHEDCYEDVFRHLRLGLNKCYAIAFENRNNVLDSVITSQLANFIKRMGHTFGMGFDEKEATRESTSGGGGPSETFKSSSSAATAVTSGGPPARTTLGEALAKRVQFISHDPQFQRLKANFNSDFDLTKAENKKLRQFIQNMKKYIKIFETKIRQLPKTWLLEERCRYLSFFTNNVVQIPLFGEYLPLKHCFVNIARFMPKVEAVFRHNVVAKRFSVRGINGRIYPYLVINDSSWVDAEREDRFLHLLRLLNIFLLKNKETARRQLYFTVPKVISSIPNCRIVEDNPSAVSLIDIFKAHFARRGSDPESPIAIYYDRLLSAQTKGMTPNSLDTLKEIFNEIQTNMAPRTLLNEWVIQSYPDATDYWHFRKLFTQQLALAGVCEYAFHLTRQNPDMMYIHRDTGLVNISYFRFDLKEEDATLDHSRTVPFRLTSSLANFLTEAGIQGTYSATINATANCMVYPNYKIKNLLYCIFRDEILHWHRRTRIADKINYLSQLTHRASQTVLMLNNISIEKHEMANATSIDEEPSSATLGLRFKENIEELEARWKQEINKHQQFVQQAMREFHAEITDIDRKTLWNLVERSVAAILARFQGIATVDESDSKLSSLITTATSVEKLCQTDPAWHPWL